MKKEEAIDEVVAQKRYIKRFGLLALKSVLGGTYTMFLGYALIYLPMVQNLHLWYKWKRPHGLKFRCHFAHKWKHTGEGSIYRDCLRCKKHQELEIEVKATWKP